MKKILALFFILTAFKSYAASTSDFLDSYEEIVDIYASYADKSQFCNSDNMTLLTEVLPKLTQFGQQAQTMQGQFNADELQRYLALAQKFSTTMQKLAPKMQNINC